MHHFKQASPNFQLSRTKSITNNLKVTKYYLHNTIQIYPNVRLNNPILVLNKHEYLLLKITEKKCKQPSNVYCKKQQPDTLSYNSSLGHVVESISIKHHLPHKCFLLLNQYYSSFNRNHQSTLVYLTQVYTSCCRPNYR